MEKLEKEKLEKVTKVFIQYTEKVKSLNVQQETQLNLYGLYKQINFGDNTTPQPNFFDFRGLAKWNAWNVYKGISSKFHLMHMYIQLVKNVQNNLIN